MEPPPGAQAPADISSLPHGLAAQLFSLLSPRTLATCACVSRGWRQLSLEQAWGPAYASLWPVDAATAVSCTATATAEWQRRFAARQLQARCWLGRPDTDKLVGHGSAVKACCLLPGGSLLFTGEALGGMGC